MKHLFSEETGVRGWSWGLAPHVGSRAEAVWTLYLPRFPLSACPTIH